MLPQEPRTDHADALRRSLEALRESRRRVEKLEARLGGGLAVVGMACRFPGGASDPQAYWRMLCEGRDAVSEVPTDRWDAAAFYDPDPGRAGRTSTRWGGFVDDVAGFDAEHFGLAPREAARIDPQQRMLLELVWEALLDACIPPDSIAGTSTGVFVGLSSSDYDRMSYEDPEAIDSHTGTGVARNVAAGRISHVLGLTGPAMVIDTACSSSLVALSIACRSLRCGECDLALVGAASLMLSPAPAIGAAKMGLLARDGRCKAFDARADGIVGGEGAALLVLRRASDVSPAEAPPWAIIAGTAVNHDGRSSALTAPNGRAQARVIRQALADAGIGPDVVGFVEAHGTGTPLGDPIEFEALTDVFEAVSRSPRRFVGSVKSNLGHLEAAAGMASLIKATLAVRYGRVPPQIHFDRPNPRMDLESSPFEIPSEARDWPRVAEQRWAGVSSFGWSGTNAHVVVCEAPPPAVDATPPGTRLLCLSAGSPEALRRLARRYADALEGQESGGFPAAVHTAARLRPHLRERVCVTASNSAEAAASLREFAGGREGRGVVSGTASGTPPDLVFVFSGHGSQWIGMGTELARRHPVFRDALAGCEAAIRPFLGRSIVHDMRRLESDSSLDDVAVAQPATFAIQVALSALLDSWGIRPSAVVGHSLGEIAAAHVSGALSLEAAARVVCLKSRLLASTRGRGAMAFAELSPAEAYEFVFGRPGVGVAAINSPRGTVLAGETQPLDDAVRELEARGVYCGWGIADVASHTSEAAGLARSLVEDLKDIEPVETRVPFFSTVTTGQLDGRDLSADYWARNLTETVLFWPTIERMATLDRRIFVEVSPHPILVSSLRDGFVDAQGTEVIATLVRERDETASLLDLAGRLHSLGSTLDLGAVCASASAGHLPAVEWTHRPFWLPSRPQGAGASNRTRRGAGGRPFADRVVHSSQQPERTYVECDLDPAIHSFLRDHRIGSAVVFPAAATLEAMLESLAGSGCSDVEVRDVELRDLLVIEEGEWPLLQLVCDRSAGTLELSARASGRGWTLAATATVPSPNVLQAKSEASETAWHALRVASGEAVQPQTHYQLLADRGIDYGPSFRGIAGLRRLRDGARADLSLPEEVVGPRGYLVHPALLDAAMQSALAALGEDAAEDAAVWVPRSFESVRWFSAAGAPARALARRVRSAAEHSAEADDRTFDVVIEDPEDRRILEIHGMRLARLTQTPRLGAAFYETEWERVERRRSSNAVGGTWIVAGEPGNALVQVVQRLRGRGDRVIRALVGDALRRLGADEFEIVPGDRQCLSKLVTEVAHEGPVRAIVNVVPASADGESPAIAQETGCLSALAWIQAGIDFAGEPRPQLVFVTSGALAAGEADRGEGTAHASVWGMARVAREEHPELVCRCIDLDPRRAPEDAAAGLVDELLSDEGEPEVALRRDGPLAPRLRRSPRPLPGGPTADRIEVARSDGTYLVTGGLGGLGFAVATDLAERGAGRLLLLGRNAHGPAAERSADALRAVGAEVSLLRVDVCDEDALRRSLEGEVAIRGVVHAAGVLDDGVILAQDAARFRGVLAPKVLGAWNLHRIALGLDLDYFVLFSSMASILGAGGQSNYAAANAYLDAFAEARCRMGQPALSINWGPWATVGLAAQADERGGRANRRGLHSLEPDDALRAMWALVEGGVRGQRAIADVDWQRWFGGAVGSETSSLLRHLFVATSVHDRCPRGWIREQLEALDEGWHRRNRLEGILLREIAAVLERDESEIGAEQPLANLGLDSLMSLELRKRLEWGADLRLSTTLVWNHPSLELLAPELARRMGFCEEVDSQSACRGEASSPVGLADLDEGALRRLLAAELRQGLEANRE